MPTKYKEFFTKYWDLRQKVTLLLTLITDNKDTQEVIEELKQLTNYERLTPVK